MGKTCRWCSSYCKLIIIIVFLVLLHFTTLYLCLVSHDVTWFNSVACGFGTFICVVSIIQDAQRMQKDHV